MNIAKIAIEIINSISVKARFLPDIGSAF